MRYVLLQLIAGIRRHFGLVSSMDVTIQLVGPNDAALLDNVSDEVFDHVVKREYLEAFLANPSNLLMVAVVNHTVIRMTSGIIYTHPDKPLQLFINEVGVAESYQRRGVGTQLLKGSLSEGEARGCTEAWVATEERNFAARALYSAASGHQDPEKAVVYSWQFESEGGVA